MNENYAPKGADGDSEDFSEVNFHRGNTLLRLSNTYPSLLQTVIEAIQNGIDGEATRIFVGIDMRTHRVSIADNGKGVDVFTFEKALGSVGQTIKAAGKLGRFGLGLVSPLNKCRRFTFTTSPANGTGRTSTRWTFEAQEISTHHKDLKIPRQTLNGTPGVFNVFREYLVGEFKVLYRTVVNMDRVTEDKVISIMDLDELESETLSKLGNAMRRSLKPIKILVVLLDDKGRLQRREITASDFTGEKLPPLVYQDNDAGKVTISLYRAQRRSGQRRGLVSVMEADSPSSISMHDFSRQARMMKEWKDDTKGAIAALASGYFEGSISADKITLSPERSKFENNAALHGLYSVLWLWYEEHGKSQFQNEQDVSRENRYQELGLQSQQRIKDILNQPAGERILAALHASVKFGRLGNGHSSPTSGKPDGIEPIPSVRIGQGGAGVPRKPTAVPQPPKATEPPKPKERDRPGDTPFGATGPRGTNRRLVQGDSQGLWYEHSDLATSSRLWEF
ncbi:MAG: ATP-binding protein, partial [Candidatus Microsaccharimonas sp.]